MSKKDFKAAGAAMDKFFSNSSAETADDPAKNNITEPKKIAQKSNKQPKKVFSFRAAVPVVDDWRLWADAKGMKVDELGEKALQEYIRKHPLTEEQKQIYELKKAQKKS